MDAEADLLATIEHAYTVFGKYHLSGSVDVCKCPVCLDSGSERQLLATPLRKIGAQLLASYSHAAKPTDPHAVAATLRYFLPRYFELIARNDWPVHFGEETALQTLVNANFPVDWLATESDAIEDYFRALFRINLLRPVEIEDEFHPLISECHIEKILCLIARANGQIAPRLIDWDGATAQTSDLHLALLVAAARQSLPKKRRLQSAFWADRRDAEKMIVDWLLRPATRDRLGAAFYRETNVAMQAIYSNGHQLIDALLHQ